MRRLQLLFILFVLSFSNYSSAQLVGGNMFLQGHWLEIGMDPNASFGACSSPLTYHAHNGGTTATPGAALAEVYDYGHDGWTTGAPAFMGDYTYPGSPFEGWEMQVGTGRAQMFQDCAGFINTVAPFAWTPGAGLNTYSNAGGVIKGNWAGITNTGISVKQETRIDTNASWVVVTTKFYNTTAAAIPNIYYMRSCDPDNDETWSGSFTTNNYIDYQHLADPAYRVQVRATTVAGFGGGTADDYPLALCTKDCRAVACIYNSWPLTVTQDLAAVWNMTYGPPGSGAYYTATGHTPTPTTGDIGIALVYNIGTLCPGDSTFISYAYGFQVTAPGNPLNGITNVDSAFPEPNIVVNGVPGNPTSAAPAAIYDTFNACAHPGMTTLDVNLISAGTGVWTWSTWAWSPGTGLATTTGLTNTINLLSLPPSITYTITGTAFGACGGTTTSTCGARTIYLTVLTCNGATVNSPCLGDSLHFNAPGDSTGATYVWYGPNSFTTSVASTQSFTISPSSWADTGTYYVVKTVAGTHDTASTIVILHPIAPISGTLSVCQGSTITLTDAIAGGTWSSVTPAVATIGGATGLVTGVSGGTTIISYATGAGCAATAVLTVNPIAPIGGALSLCAGTTSLLTNAVTGGTWSSGTPGVATIGASTGLVAGITGGTSTIVYTTPAGCTVTAVVTVNPKPNITATSNSPLCIGVLDTLRLFSTTGGAGALYSWTGPSAYTATAQNPTVPGFAIADTGIYTVIVTTPFGCKDTSSTHVIELPPPVAPIVTDPNPYCYNAPFIPFTITGVTGTVYWYPTSSGGVGSTTTPVVNTSIPGTYTFFFRQTVGSCESNIDSITIVVYPPVIPNFTYNVHFGCSQDTVFFTNTSTSTAGVLSYSWNFGDGTSAVSDINPMHIYSQPGTIQNVTLTATFGSCSQTWTEHPNTSHSVQAAFVPVLDTICAGQSSTMVNSSSATLQGLPGTIVSYLWNFGDGTTDITAGPSHTFTNPGIYDVSLTITDELGCTSSANANVYAIGLKIKSWHDTTLCLRGPMVLNTTVVQFPDLGLSDYTYLWAPSDNLEGNSGYFAIFTGFGSYTITETVSLPGTWGACVAIDTMVIHSVLGKQFTNVTASTTILYGSSIQLNADSLINYWWIPDNGSLNNPNINNPIATPDTTTTYTVYGMDKYGCVDSAFVTIHVDSNMHECIPSGFTPNGDGLNDIFRPVGIKFQNLVEFRIYNRWGQQVFYTTSPEQGWDGTFNGVVQDIGTYYYTIIVGRPGGKGDNLVYKGDVTLIK